MIGRPDTRAKRYGIRNKRYRKSEIIRTSTRGPTVAAVGRVHISLDAIGALPAERIGCRFGEQTVRASGNVTVGVPAERGRVPVIHGYPWLCTGSCTGDVTVMMQRRTAHAMVIPRSWGRRASWCNGRVTVVTPSCSGAPRGVTQYVAARSVRQVVLKILQCRNALRSVATRCTMLQRAAQHCNIATCCTLCCNGRWNSHSRLRSGTTKVRVSLRVPRCTTRVQPRVPVITREHLGP
jgi:hypothetical protein